MKRTILFGAGQIGAMTARLMGAEYDCLCFADNFAAKWGQSLAGLEIRPVETALSLSPDCVVLCVLDDERAAAMEEQLKALGYKGELMRPTALISFDARRATMRLLAEQINSMGVVGDVAELGVFRGDFASALNAAFPERDIHLFDTFEGFADKDVQKEQSYGWSKAKAGDFSDTSLELVSQKLKYPERAHFHVGYFPDSFSGCEELCFAFVSIDADLYAPTAAALPIFYERLSPGGVIMIHDVLSTQFAGVSQAVEEFCRPRHILPMPVPDLHGSVVIRKA